jgi:hypothetical protein
MADDQNEKPQVVRFPEPVVETAREAEERCRVAEIARDIEELEGALESRDRRARFGTAERAKTQAQAQQPAKGDPSTPEPEPPPTVGHISSAPKDVSPLVGKYASAKRQAGKDGPLKAEEEARKATGGKPNSDAEVREQAEKAAANLAQERARIQALEQQLAARVEDRELLTQERARIQSLEQQLAAREDERKLLAQERARTQALEQQLAARADERKLLAQERARNQKLEEQLAARQDDQKLLSQERARNQVLEQQLAARQDDQKLLAQERSRNQALAQQLAARRDDQQLLSQERDRNRELEQQLAARQDHQKLLAQESARGQALEQQLAIRQNEAQKLLVEERVRSQELEQQLAAAEATLDRGRTATVSPSDRPASMSTAPEAPGNREAARLMAQARLLLDEGNIIAARRVLERAAENGSALALLLLAETYDRAMLSAWGIFGRRGDVTKARELYAKAVAAGVHEAKHRLSALH